MATSRFPRQAVRKLEKCEVFPLMALEGVGEIRRYIDEVEAESIARAKELGATADDIARHMGITRQGAHYKLRFSEHRLNRVRARRGTTEGEVPSGGATTQSGPGRGDGAASEKAGSEDAVGTETSEPT
jgi:hypothetical protein